MGKAILAIDQGTTGSTALLVDESGRVVGRATTEFPQHYPKPGWVEHDLEEIWASVCRSVGGAFSGSNVEPNGVVAVGITNQRETTAVWHRASGKPLCRAIVWQCRRTADECARLAAEGHVPFIAERTGLVLDAYFSATKLAWILDNVPSARKLAAAGELCFGTIESFLTYRLSGGKEHVTDASNASRTMLVNLRTLEWDADLLELFRVPSAVLPRVVGNAEIVARTSSAPFLPDGVPISGMAGDQQASLFGHGCHTVGDSKCTYGTGAFLLTNIGEEPVLSRNRLVTTVAWRKGGRVTYALEGSVFIAGAAVQWLRDGLKIIRSSDEVEALASSVADTGGVTFVPALSGLGAPYWDGAARGLLTGLTRGTGPGHIARATLEAVALQVNDLIEAMTSEPSVSIRTLRTDGGATRNGLMMQFQADVSGIAVERRSDPELTARGAAMLAAEGIGSPLPVPDDGSTTFRPSMPDAIRSRHLQAWKAAVGRAKSS